MEGVQRLAQGVSVGLTRQAGRRFGLTLGLAFLALTAVLVWRGRDSAAVVTGVGGVVLLVAGLAIPTRLAPVERAWMALAHALSRVTTPILMGIVYYVTVVPIGIVMRVLGRNPLVRARTGAGYWIETGQEARTPERMRRQF
jgi:hypothetical protein